MIQVDSLLEKIARIRVLVIGDMMLDHYIWGDVHRISPEAPVPVVHATRDTYTAGGAANVALNLANLGVQVSVLGTIGDDDAGLRLNQLLTDNGVKTINAGQKAGVPTIVKSRVIIRNQQLCRIDREASRDQYRVDTSAGFLSDIKQAVNEVDAIIISDYAKGVITQALVDLILSESFKRSDLLVAVDPKPANHISYKGAGLITPNRQEALELADIAQLHPGDEYPLVEICSRIHQKFNPDLLVITLGAEGMAICRDGEVTKSLPTAAREVFDVSGAGDTVIATLTAALVAGLNPAQATWLANGAAGCVVAHVGTVPVKLTELRAWLNAHAAMWDKL